MAAVTGIVVYSSVLFQRGHTVERWAESVQRRFTAQAIKAAPVNKRPNTGHGPPGGLKAGIHGHVDQIGPHQLETIIASDAPYSTFVLFGTQGPIHSRSGLPMNPPDNGPGRSGTPHSVAGQRSNNFLLIAAYFTGRTHRSVRFGPSFRSHLT